MNFFEKIFIDKYNENVEKLIEKYKELETENSRLIAENCVLANEIKKLKNERTDVKC